ncbi:MAG TPA: 50S ribosomal protein L2 [Candidatus Megaira endosymbiont of Hartmannula sinica]|nr:50S ribosomal protein L2 [Candidatus Megaera endosymbiont of Hartmannula sinica]
MALKKYKPNTPSQRQLVLVNKSSLWKGRPEKTLVKGLSSSGGRNNFGRITARHIGGGHKKLYRMVDFKRNKFDISATVQRIEYDPNRSSFIALVQYDDGVKSYIIAPNNIKVGDKIISSHQNVVDVIDGNAMLLKNIPVGTLVHNIEMKPRKGGQIARSAGSFVSLVGKDSSYAQLKLMSGEFRVVSLDCLATIGVVSNPDKKNSNIGKAGRNRWLGKRPSVRGVAMNPVDHPHGGGEGKTSGGRHPVSPWGVLAKGKKTRSNKRTSVFIIRKR